MTTKLHYRSDFFIIYDFWRHKGKVKEFAPVRTIQSNFFCFSLYSYGKKYENFYVKFMKNEKAIHWIAYCRSQNHLAARNNKLDCFSRVLYQMLEISLSYTPHMYRIHLNAPFFLNLKFLKICYLYFFLKELRLQRIEDSTTKDYEHTVSSNIQVYARSTKLHFKKTCSTQKGIGLFNFKK